MVTDGSRSSRQLLPVGLPAATKRPRRVPLARANQAGSGGGLRRRRGRLGRRPKQVMVQGGLPVVEHRPDPGPTGQCHHDVAGADCGTAGTRSGSRPPRAVRRGRLPPSRPPVQSAHACPDTSPSRLPRSPGDLHRLLSDSWRKAAAGTIRQEMCLFRFSPAPSPRVSRTSESSWMVAAFWRRKRGDTEGSGR